MSQFLSLTQRRREKKGGGVYVCRADFLGTDPAKALQIGCLATGKSVARTEASSSALRFRVSMNCGFRLGARSEVGRWGCEGPSEGIRRIHRGPLRRSLRPPPADFSGDRPRESIAKRVFGCRQKFFQKKFVIGCHRAHTFTWLNLLLEPKRLLQRFGFVFL